jgi:uncharacterized protein
MVSVIIIIILVVFFIVFVRLTVSKKAKKNIEQKENLIKDTFLSTSSIKNEKDLCELGNFYRNVEKNYNKMKQYYFMALKSDSEKADKELKDYFNKEGGRDYKSMKKYYLMKSKNGDVSALYNLGCYYQYVEKNYDKMKKYYLAAIKKNDTLSMHELGKYFRRVEKNYTEMKKYFNMALKNGFGDVEWSLDTYFRFEGKNDYKDKKKFYFSFLKEKLPNTKKVHGLISPYLGKISLHTAKYELDNYFNNEGKDDKDIKKYYSMLIKKGDIYDIKKIAKYYGEVKNNHKKMKKYYLMAAEKGDSDSIKQIAKLYINKKQYDKMETYCKMLFERGSSYYVEDLLRDVLYNINDYNQLEKIHKKFKDMIELDYLNNNDLNIFDGFSYANIINLVSQIGEKINMFKLKGMNLDNKKSVKKIFKNYEERYNKCKCMLCFSSDDDYYIDIRCKKKYSSNGKFSHAFCLDCYCDWFSKNDKKCLKCQDIFLTENCVFVKNKK